MFPYNIFYLIILLALSLGQSSPVPEGVGCYSVPASPYRFYATPTDYKDVRGHGTDFTLLGCTPRKFYMLSRHGIRYPLPGQLSEMHRNVSRLHQMIGDSLHKGTLCPQTQTALRNWKFSLDLKKAGLLSDTGKSEARDLGMRYSHRFPGLLGQPYSAERYKFQHTAFRRTLDTAEAMAMGMFNKSGMTPPLAFVYPRTDPQKIHSDFHMVGVFNGCDSLLRYADCCEKFIKTVRDKPFVEQEAFERGPELRRVIANVSHRLGLPEGAISLGDINLIYHSCSYEQAILGSSPWCLVFSNDDLRILEYWRDLKYYWGYGYGDSIIYEQTCDLFKDLISYLKDETTSVTGMIRVSHDSVLMPFVARLGAFRDSTNLTAKNMAEQGNRKWRTSKISAFNSNIAFVEYRCGSVSKVRVFFNEKPLGLPMCQQSGCPLSNIVNSFLKEFVGSCDFQKTCDLRNNCNGHVTHSGACVPIIVG